MVGDHSSAIERRDKLERTVVIGTASPQGEPVDSEVIPGWLANFAEEIVRKEFLNNRYDAGDCRRCDVFFFANIAQEAAYE